MIKSPKISIITVNWNGASITKRFIQNITQSNYHHYEVILINNDLEEKEEIEKLKSQKVSVFHNASNIGYAAALNQGIKRVQKDRTSECILIMNNDTLFKTDFLSQIKKNTDKNMVYSPIIFYENTKIIQSTGGNISLLLGGTTNANKGLSPKNMSQKNPDFVSGCCMFFHKSIINRVGLFDEEYHSYYEDADFCLRAKKYGISSNIIPDVFIWHQHSASTKSCPAHKVKLLSRNSILFAKKNFSFPKNIIFSVMSILRGFLQNVGKNTFFAYCNGVKNGILNKRDVYK